MVCRGLALKRLSTISGNIQKIIAGFIRCDKMGVKNENAILLGGYCPDPMCYERVLFENVKNKVVYCFYCGQRFPKGYILDKHRLSSQEILYLMNRIRTVPHRDGSEWTRVDGYSAFYCKIISFMLTTYGVDENNNVKLLSEIGQGEYFDCKHLSDYAFVIDDMHLLSNGYGIDLMVNHEYLAGTLSQIKKANNNIHVLFPLHVSGDGSCLVHAISRALVGREIYWHALRENLKRSLMENEEWYKKTFGEFIADDDWQEIVKECDADYLPRDDRLGLRTAHIFVLSNVLHRPIILLDTPDKIKTGADFSAIFLPVLHKVDECKDKSGNLNKPIVIGWANETHSHFVPLVAAQNQPAPKLPRWFLPKAWCVSDDQIEKYILFEHDVCEVSTGRLFTSEELNNLLTVMEKEFTKQKGVSPLIISDYCEDELHETRINSSKFDRILIECLSTGKENCLMRCLYCWRLFVKPIFKLEYCKRGGKIYENLLKRFKRLIDGECYEHDLFGLFKYNKLIDCFELERLRFCLKCQVSKYQIRTQSADGRIMYFDRDHSRTPAPTSLCPRKMKHIWHGAEYDNLPLILDIDIVYKNSPIKETIYWFAFESDKSRNSTIDKVVREIVETNCKEPNEMENMLKVLSVSLEEFLKNFPCNSNRLCIDPLWSVEHYLEEDKDFHYDEYIEPSEEFSSDNESSKQDSSTTSSSTTEESDKSPITNLGNYSSASKN